MIFTIHEFDNTYSTKISDWHSPYSIGIGDLNTLTFIEFNKNDIGRKYTITNTASDVLHRILTRDNTAPLIESGYWSGTEIALWAHVYFDNGSGASSSQRLAAVDYSAYVINSVHSDLISWEVNGTQTRIRSTLYIDAVAKAGDPPMPPSGLKVVG